MNPAAKRVSGRISGFGPMAFLPIARILVATLTMIVVGLITYAVFHTGSFDYRTATREDAEFWFVREIQNRGGQAAYSDFLASVIQVSADKQHIFAHVFGSALYKIHGIDGFSICDDRFQYGCFHELIGRAITEHGFSITSDVLERCMRTSAPRPFACSHGIGHGIISYLGYARSGLDTALSVCDGISSDNLIIWCHGGVFMEYNQQSMLGIEYVRELASHDMDMYEPCLGLSEKYQRACVFEQPQWWYRVLSRDGSLGERFARLGGYCERMPASQELIRTCFEGVGNITTPAVYYDPHRAAALCDVASSHQLNQLFCKSIAALSLASITHEQWVGEAVCEGLSGEGLSYCLAYAHREAKMWDNRPAPSSL